MFLNEIFNAHADFHIVRDEPEKFVTMSIIGGRIITVLCYGFIDEMEISRWTVAFEETKNGNSTFKATGSGNELEVFNAVIKTIRELVSKHNPDYIDFTVDQSEDISEKRADLYDRLVYRYMPKDYKLNRRNLGDVQRFTLTHKGVNQKYWEYRNKDKVE